MYGVLFVERAAEISDKACIWVDKCSEHIYRATLIFSGEWSEANISWAKNISLHNRVESKWGRNIKYFFHACLLLLQLPTEILLI